MYKESQFSFLKKIPYLSIPFGAKTRQTVLVSTLAETAAENHIIGTKGSFIIFSSDFSISHFFFRCLMSLYQQKR